MKLGTMDKNFGDFLKTQFPKLSIFETFKTKKQQLTGEAIRQRDIISHLAREDSSTLMTRTAIAQNIAKKNNLLWKNLYSGVFQIGRAHV